MVPHNPPPPQIPAYCKKAVALPGLHLLGSNAHQPDALAPVLSRFHLDCRAANVGLWIWRDLIGVLAWATLVHGCSLNLR